MPPEQQAVEQTPDPSVTERIAGLLSAEEGEQPEQPQAKRPEREEPEPTPAPQAAHQEPESEEQPQPEAKETDEAPEPGEDVEEITVGSLADIAEHLGVDVADLYQVPIPITTPEGRKEVTIGEWKDAIQSQEALNSERAKVAEEAQQRSEQLQRWSTTMEQSLTQAAGLITAAEQELTREYQAINWQELRQVDPAEFAARQQEFNQRAAGIEQAKQGALYQLQQAEQQRSAMMQEQLPEQNKRLVQLIPEWGNEETAGNEKTQVAEYLLKAGYTQSYVSELYDARTVAIAYKAMKYDALKSSKPAKKRVLKIGNKPIKPGSSRSKADKKQDSTRDQRARFHKSGKVGDLAALLNTDEFLGDM